MDKGQWPYPRSFAFIRGYNFFLSFLTVVSLKGLNAMRTACLLITAYAVVLVSAIVTTERDAEAAEVAGSSDLTRAVVIAPAGLSPREKKAVAMLIDEVEKRTQIRWQVAAEWPATDGTPVIVVGTEPILQRDYPRTNPWLKRLPAEPGAEGYRIQTPTASTVLVVGNDARGVLFGIGRLLRELRMAQGKILLPAGFQVATAPTTALRGHQLGYRQKTNSYDAWDLPQWEQYYRDLAIFGTNAVELIPPRSDDDPDSPHFPRPPLEMMAGMSRLADEYGLDVWLWYPALDEDYSKPATVEFALKEWAEVFQKLPRVDALFVPGGDPGHTHPKPLMAMLERQAASLRKYHPQAKIWVAPQGFNPEWLEEFLQILKTEPQWFDGVVFGPQIFVSLPELRKRIPERYPIRGYPDITHSINCQHPVPDWDTAFGLTQSREVINPRPLGQAAIFRHYRDSTIGFISYSEGCNDDVNKFIWSGLGWDPKTPVVDILRHYGRYFIGDLQSEGIAQGLLALERNWQGPLATNGNVETTLLQFQKMERSASPAELLNWRFQQALYRAYYDAYLRDRLLAETAQEAAALDCLRRARRIGALPGLEQAHAILSQATRLPVAEDRRTRVNELAEALYQSIRMQLSTERYKGDRGRGTSQDTLDTPLNSRLWLEGYFDTVRKMSEEKDRLATIELIVNRTDPGPGGFYDDLGDLARQPHLVRGAGFDHDPDFRRSSVVGFDSRPGLPTAWSNYAQSLYDAPLELHYQGLDAHGKYRVRVVYADDSNHVRIRLDADGKEVHPLMKKPDPPESLEFDVPPTATADGELTLSWFREPGRGGNGRGCQVREVWLIRKAD
jgi:hypothetical protein